MLKSFFVCLIFGLLLIPVSGFAQSSVLSSGSISLSNGLPDKDLKYEDFRVTDGFITGNIVNTSGKARSGIKLDVWTTNMQETRIFWRKIINVGELGPHAKYTLKEPYKADDEDASRLKFMFKFTSDANFRNK